MEKEKSRPVNRKVKQASGIKAETLKSKSTSRESKVKQLKSELLKKVESWQGGCTCESCRITKESYKTLIEKCQTVQQLEKIKFNNLEV